MAKALTFIIVMLLFILPVQAVIQVDLGPFTEVDPIYQSEKQFYMFFNGTNSNASWIQFNTSYVANGEPTGRMYWNPVDGAIDFKGLNDVTVTLGQDLFFYGKADGAISKGQVVQFAGVQGDHILVKKANATEIDLFPEYLIGLASQDLTNNEFGYFTWFGKLDGVYTNTPENNDTVNWANGDILYFNPTTGQLTNVEPAAPNRKIIIAAVIKEQTGSAQNGILLVRPTFDKKLIDIDDVNITSPSSGQVLRYSSITGTWFNDDIPSPDLSGYVPYTGATGNVNLNAKNITNINTIDVNINAKTNNNPIGFCFNGSDYIIGNYSGVAGCPN